jgi:hypothetical protein
LTTAIVAVVVLAAPLVVAEQPAIPDDFVVTLARSTCFGECPAYSVAIDAHGNVTYEGKKFVRVEGQQSDRVPLSRVAALAATVERIRFFDLDDRYRAIRTPDGGHFSITDGPTTFVWVTSGGRSKSVEDYIGAPEGLRQLEKQIDDTARTKHWITLDEPTLREMVRAGWTPSAQEGAELLRKALQEDNVSVIKALLENGVDPNGTNYGTNMTPLLIVQSAAAAGALLEAGANPSVRTQRGVTPLIHAPQFAPELTEVLLKTGIPADQQDVDGRTALLQASCLGNARVVKILLARGADPTRHTDRASPLGCARDGKDYERLYPQRLIEIDSPFIKDFDAVIALLEQALAIRQRK